MKVTRLGITIYLVIVVVTAVSIVFLWKGYFTPSSAITQYSVKVAFPNLSFEFPVGLYDAGDETNRLFVVEQRGVIRVFNNTENVSVVSVFVNVTDRVLYGGEQGLLGLAFHPNYTQNGFFYLDYVADNPRRTIISRYNVSMYDRNQADGNSEMTLLEILQPFPNHKGGQMSFGPDGYLYIAMGDGGGAGDPLGNARNLSSLLGKILCIDVDTISAGLNYSIPPDNPFVGNAHGFREEIFAYGFRNPWRFSFDPVTGWLWAADVGQNRIEEIDIIQKGKNYGWNIMEGTLCYNPPSTCNQTGLEMPVWEYDHTLGYSVTGGFVYRGLELPELTGAYIYADYGSGRIWSLRYDGVNASNTELVDTGLNIPSFGLDQEQNLYVCAFDGRIYKLYAPTSDMTPPNIQPPTQTPLQPNIDEQVQVAVNVTDDLSGVREVILSYTNNSIWTNVTMTNATVDIYTANITSMPYQTQVRYQVIAYDNANNQAVNDNSGSFYQYIVIPEFPESYLPVALFISAALVTTVLTRKMRAKPKLL